jgi:hypothetical protein
MKIKGFWFFGVLICFSMVNCGPKLSVTTFDNIGNYNKYRTYAYLPNTDFDVSDSISGHNGKVTQAVVEAINTNMQRAGYTLDRDNPDLLVVLNTNFDKSADFEVNTVYANPEKEEGADPISAYYDPYYYWKYAEFNDVLGYRIKENKSQKTGLAIELIDRGAQEIIWRGEAIKSVDRMDSSTKISEYVAAIFEEYPTIEERG